MINTADKRSASPDRGMLHAEIQELLDEYADIRDELEDTLESFLYLQSEIGFAMEDITEELERLQVHLNTCSTRLRRFRLPRCNT